MKYVLMYTNRPDLDAAIPPERQQEVYQAIYAWFGQNARLRRHRRRAARAGDGHHRAVR